MEEVALLLGAEDTPQLSEEISKAHSLQQVLQGLVYYKHHKEDPHIKYTINEYQKLCNSINWLDYINNILGPKIQVTGDKEVLFPPPEVFQKWFDVIEMAPKRVQANYIMWTIVEGLLPYLSRELGYQKLGLQKRQDRDGLCFDIISIMGLIYPTQIMLYRQHTSHEKRQKLEDVLVNMKGELMQSLNRSTLFKMTNRKRALSRIKSLKIEVVPNDDYFSDNIFDKLVVEKINPDKNSFLELLAQAAKNKKTFQYLRLQNPNLYFRDTVIVMPNYKEDENIIYAPGLATHNMYFDEKRPNYINYAIIGSLLQYAINQVLEKSVETNQTSISIGKCISEGNFGDHESKLLAYLAIGQQISYGSYNSWVKKNGKELALANVQNTPNQIFWISTASLFCKPSNFHGFYSSKLLNPKEYIFRAIKNNQRFARDFNCPMGSAMVPTSKCGVI